MRAGHLLFQDVSFSYDSSAPLFERLSCDCGPGWTGVVGGNGSGKTTLLKLAAGLLEPVSGAVVRPGGACPPLYVPQRTDFSSVEVADFLAAEDAAACALRGLLGIRPDWCGRWETLSHGERKKAQVAVALWRRPAVLALDEPANHLDRDARILLREALRKFPGAGLLVSHDRELLDELCIRCIFIRPPAAAVRPGGYSRGLDQERNEDERARLEREKLKDELVRLKRERERRRELKPKKTSAAARRKAAAGDPDARFRKNAGRLTNKDAAAGRLARQLDGRLRRAGEELAGAAAKKTYAAGVWVAGAVSSRRLLFALEPAVVPFGNGAGLRHPRLEMRPTDRVALTGPNGAGKSTLIRRITAGLTLDPKRVIYLPQELTLAASRQLLADVLALSKAERGRVLALVSRLGSRPERLFATAEPSPGEARKLLLALGILREPHLVVMDEPTNHLDATAVQCLQDALADCPCGLLLASHDRRFLGELTKIEWRIAPAAAGYELTVG
jgi:macrolide transport system ATP-binding/permease protein